MAAVSSQPPTGLAGPRPPSIANGNATADYINGHGVGHAPRPPNTVPSAPAPAVTSKRSKAKKAADPTETGKLLAAKINQLELDAAGERSEEQEIDREVRKATRDLNNLLAGMGTPMERMEALQKKNAELLTDMKRLEREHLKGKKRADQLQKEKDAQRSELSKAIGVKDKLEKLAREMTKDNKKLKEDIKRLEDMEARQRQAANARDQAQAEDYCNFLDDKPHPATQRTNMEVEELFRQKFRSFIDQYSVRELHFLSLTRTKEAEIQNALGRLEHQRRLSENEAARCRQLSAQVSTFSQTETELRSQLNIYVEKFKQVEDTLNNSNDLFLTFRKEMEEMSKKTKRLEKENLTLTRKHDLSNRNILEMAEERTRVTKENETLRKKSATLESVIRRMQDQGRGPPVGGGLEVDEDGTESEYDSEEEEEDYEGGSEEVEYDDETEDDLTHAATATDEPPTFGPVPPPSAPAQILTNGYAKGEVNGIKH